LLQLLIDSVQFVSFVVDLLVKTRQKLLVSLRRLFEFTLNFLLQQTEMNIDRFALGENIVRIVVVADRRCKPTAIIASSIDDN
jgi:hypothetical protein